MLSVDIGDVPRWIDSPTLDRIEVVDRSERTVRSADRDQLLEGRLDVAGLVRAPALQDRGLAIPHPGITETDRADRFRGDVKLRRLPGLTAVKRNIDRLHPATSAP